MGRFLSPDWSEHPVAIPYAELANPQSLNLYQYVDNNPLSKADLDGHDSLKYQRSKAIEKAWDAERKMVARTGQGTRNWTAAQKAELLATGRVSGYQGHHTNSVAAHPDLAGNPDNVGFRTRGEHFEEHDFNWANPTSGPLLSRALGILQIIQLATSALGAYMQTQTTGIQVGSALNPNSLTIADQGKAATTLDGQVISVTSKDGTSSLYSATDGQFVKYGCTESCTIGNDALKGSNFQVVDKKNIT